MAEGATGRENVGSIVEVPQNYRIARLRARTRPSGKQWYGHFIFFLVCERPDH